MKRDYDPVLGRVPSGIFILTAADGEQSTGMLASWVMQAGFEPPMVTVAVNLRRYVCDWLTAGRPFALNLVGEHDKNLLRHFVKGFDLGAAAFEGLELVAGGDGRDDKENGPAILADAVGHLVCEPAGHVDSGDHRVFLARVVGGRLHEEKQPMVHIRRSGARY